MCNSRQILTSRDSSEIARNSSWSRFGPSGRTQTWIISLLCFFLHSLSLFNISSATQTISEWIISLRAILLSRLSLLCDRAHLLLPVLSQEGETGARSFSGIEGCNAPRTIAGYQTQQVLYDRWIMCANSRHVIREKYCESGSDSELDRPLPGVISDIWIRWQLSDRVCCSI